MNSPAATTVQAIPLAQLAFTFVPVALVIYTVFRWTGDARGTLVAFARMLVQLLAVGYLLAFVFALEHALPVIAVLAIMLCVASTIVLRPLRDKNTRIYLHVLASLLIGGCTILPLVTIAVLRVEPWYLPRVTIPLAGMIFANAMTTVTLCAERFEAERSGGLAYEAARRIAFRAALIPLTNALLAVGVVSLPGMMTGQILSGVSPLVAARYQIMVMCMTFSAGGIAAAAYLAFARARAASSDNGGERGGQRRGRRAG